LRHPLRVPPSLSLSAQQGVSSYRLKSFALTLTFADGDVRRRTMFAASSTEPIQMISVEGEIYAKQR
jgi:hypothetical protein